MEEIQDILEVLFDKIYTFKFFIPKNKVLLSDFKEEDFLDIELSLTKKKSDELSKEIEEIIAKNIKTTIEKYEINASELKAQYITKTK